MTSMFVRFAEMGWPWRLLITHVVVALQAAAIAVATAHVFMSVTPNLLNRSSYVAAWLNRFAMSQRKAILFFSLQIALATTIAAAPPVMEHLENRRNIALQLLVLLEVLAGLITAPYAARRAQRRHPTNATFLKRVTADLVAGRLSGAFAEVVVGGAELRYPSVGVPPLRYAAGAATSSLVQPAARHLVAPRARASKKRASAKRRSKAHRCCAPTADGTKCRNRGTHQGETCHLHRRRWQPTHH
jgi:hypothetical protein